MKKRTYYMHTLDGKPGCFLGGQICFAQQEGKPNKLRESLKQIRKEQEASDKYRAEQGYDNDDVEMGYCRFTLP